MHVILGERGPMRHTAKYFSVLGVSAAHRGSRWIHWEAGSWGQVLHPREGAQTGWGWGGLAEGKQETVLQYLHAPDDPVPPSRTNLKLTQVKSFGLTLLPHSCGPSIRVRALRLKAHF